MEKRTWALLVALVIAIAAWAIYRPKPTSLDDPSWTCPTGVKTSSWDCIRK